MRAIICMSAQENVPLCSVICGSLSLFILLFEVSILGMSIQKQIRLNVVGVYWIEASWALPQSLLHLMKWFWVQFLALQILLLSFYCFTFWNLPCKGINI